MTATPANSFSSERPDFSLLTSLPERSVVFHRCYPRCDSLSFPSMFIVALGSVFSPVDRIFHAPPTSIGKITKMIKIFLVFLASLYTLHLITQVKRRSLS